MWPASVSYGCVDGVLSSVATPHRLPYRTVRCAVRCCSSVLRGQGRRAAPRPFYVEEGVDSIITPWDGRSADTSFVARPSRRSLAVPSVSLNPRRNGILADRIRKYLLSMFSRKNIFNMFPWEALRHSVRTLSRSESLQLDNPQLSFTSTKGCSSHFPAKLVFKQDESTGGTSFYRGGCSFFH